MWSLFRPQELPLSYFEIGFLKGQELADMARLTGQGVQARLSPLSLCSVASGSTYPAFYLYIFILTWILETGLGIELRSSCLHAKNLMTKLSTGHQTASCKQHWESRVHLGEDSISSLSKSPQWSQKTKFPPLFFPLSYLTDFISAPASLT